MPDVCKPNDCSLREAVLAANAKPGADTANPKIGKLRRNGGPTQTIELKKGSPALGRAIEAFATPRDQRGRRRDGNPDSGAYERGA